MKPNSPNKRKPIKPSVSKQFVVKSVPIAKSSRFTPSAPKLRNNGRNITVSHTEYIADISSFNAAFNVTSFSVNPGLNATFPWLANIASNYESYKFKKLQFEYKPICPTTTAGKTILAFDYDAADTAPSTKVQINSYESTVSCSVWDSTRHSSTNSNLLKFGVQRYVRSGSNPSNTDIKTYDIGKFYLATSNTPATAMTLGELFVTYEVELLTPQLPNQAPTFIPSEPSATPFYQFGKVIVDALGVASLSAQFVNKPMYILGKQFVDAGLTVLDIALNPLVTAPMKMDFYNNMSGAQIGQAPSTLRWPTSRSNGFAPPFPFTTDIFQNGSGYAYSTILTPAPFGPAASALTELSNNLQSIRIRLPFGSTANLNMYGLSGSVPMITNNLGTLSSILGLINDVDIINWPSITDSLPSLNGIYTYDHTLGDVKNWMNY